VSVSKTALCISPSTKESAVRTLFQNKRVTSIIFNHSNNFDDATYMCLLASSRNKLEAHILKKS
jgi:hypothetical protein